MKRKINRIKTDIHLIASARCKEQIAITWNGAYDLDPRHLVFWICVRSDGAKENLQNDVSLQTEFRQVLDNHDYPEEARKFVQIGIESQETVDRESNGNWWHHFK